VTGEAFLLRFDVVSERRGLISSNLVSSVYGGGEFKIVVDPDGRAWIETGDLDAGPIEMTPGQWLLRVAV